MLEGDPTPFCPTALVTELTTDPATELGKGTAVAATIAMVVAVPLPCASR